ncbi:MAG: TSUP family transporter, partial [Candidatus Thorarchaeota archaeon]|nr:TSUP family transporter [Candidatus Thorarchaeota archaeon]
MVIKIAPRIRSEIMDYGLILLVGIIGFISGLASGFFGIGGGSIRIPLLNLIGFSIIASYGINLMTLPVSSLIGAVSQRKNIDIKLGTHMIIGGSIGTVIGTLIAFSLSTSALVLAILFLIVSLVSVIGMNLNHIATEASQKLKASFFGLFFTSLAANILTGMR